MKMDDVCLQSIMSEETRRLLNETSSKAAVEIEDDGKKKRAVVSSVEIEDDEDDTDEQSYVRKLDVSLTVASCLGYFAKNLIQSSILVSYVNGMDTYFEMDHNQYNYLLSIWTVGYFMGQFPSHYIIPRVNLRWFLGFLQLSWCFISVCQFYVTSLRQLYVIRFVLALCQAPLFISLEFLLGSWWTKHELNKRSTFLAVSSSMASIISGPLQQYVIVHFANSNTPAFKKMFLVDAGLTLPVAIYTLVMMPNVPLNSSNWFWTQQDYRIMASRHQRMTQTSKRMTQTSSRQVTPKDNWWTWELFVFPLMFYAFNNSNHANGQPTFINWMKQDLKLPSSKYNVIPSYLHLASIVLAVVAGFLSDKYHSRLNHWFISLYFVCMILGTSVLVVWQVPQWLHWLSYFIMALPANWCQPQIFSWVNRILIMGGDDHKRSFVVMSTNVLAYIIGSWVPIFVWNTSDSPRYLVGFVYTGVLSVFGLAMTWTGVYYSRRATLA